MDFFYNRVVANVEKKRAKDGPLGDSRSYWEGVSPIDDNTVRKVTLD